MIDWQPWDGQQEWPADKARPVLVRLRNGEERGGKHIASFDWSDAEVWPDFQVTDVYLGVQQ